jgi:hypothetical protein
MDAPQCHRILEVSENASMEEITQAYLLMKRIYEKERAVFSAPSMDEFSSEARTEILEEIEVAYRELTRLHAKAQPQIHPARGAFPEGNLPIDGAALRRTREAAGISLEYVASETHVRVEYLSALEDERFWDLPPAAVNVRGFLTAYTTEIGLPAEHVVPPYMRRFQEWQAKRTK